MNADLKCVRAGQKRTLEHIYKYIIKYSTEKFRTAKKCYYLIPKKKKKENNNETSIYQSKYNRLYMEHVKIPFTPFYAICIPISSCSANYSIVSHLNKVDK